MYLRVQESASAAGAKSTHFGTLKLIGNSEISVYGRLRRACFPVSVMLWVCLISKLVINQVTWNSCCNTEFRFWERSRTWKRTKNSHQKRSLSDGSGWWIVDSQIWGGLRRKNLPHVKSIKMRLACGAFLRQKLQNSGSPAAQTSHRNVKSFVRQHFDFIFQIW